MSIKKFNYRMWSLIVALIGSIAAVLAIPEIRCGIGLFSATCTTTTPQVAQAKDVELITKTETGEALEGVKVEVIAKKGPPEPEFSDSNGYAKIKILAEGDVLVTLSKSGYPTKNFNINLSIDQNQVRIIRLTKSGQLEVSSLPKIPDPVPPNPTLSLSPSPSPSVSQVDNEIMWEFKKCIRKQTNINCSFVLTTTKERMEYGFSLHNDTKLTDLRGHEYFVSEATFVDTKGSKNSYREHLNLAMSINA
jgi:hypothetical protein